MEAAADSTMSESKAPPRAAPLFKHLSWSPDILRDEAWSRRKSTHKLRRSRRCKSVTDDDLDELKACFELGFGFDSDSPDIDPKLSDAFPALELYHTVNKQYQSLSRTTSSVSTAVSDSDTSSFSVESASTIFDSVGDPEMVKARLRQWAQVVACVVRQSSPN